MLSYILLEKAYNLHLNAMLFETCFVESDSINKFHHQFTTTCYITHTNKQSKEEELAGSGGLPMFHSFLFYD